MEGQEINSQEQNNGNILMTNQNEDSQTLGQTLKIAREEKGFSIEMISRHTKINTSTLHAIEKDDTDSLPNIAYLRGFVKSYAKIVNLEESLALEKLNMLFNIEKPQEINEHPEDQQSATTQKKEEEVKLEKKTVNHVTDDEQKNNNSNSMVKVAVAVGAIVIISTLFLINSGSEESQEAMEAKEEVASSEIKTVQINENTPLKEVIEEPKEEKSEVVTDKQEEVKSEAVVQEEPTKEEDTEDVEAQKTDDELSASEESVTTEKKEEEKEEEKEETIRFYNISLPMFEILDDKEALAKYVPESFSSSVIEGKQNLFINAANGDTWITYKKDNDPIKKFILKKGRFLMIRGDEIKIFFGNVLETKVFLNNQLLSINTKSGVKSIVLPESLAAKTKLPLFIFNKDGSVQTSDEYISKLDEKETSQD